MPSSINASAIYAWPGINARTVYALPGILHVIVSSSINASAIYAWPGINARTVYARAWASQENWIVRSIKDMIGGTLPD